ncbi:HIT family protein [Thiohalophilus sp.]|uniref:HIT family protein n=1 Tax=Thiohalophilus sp. TaxID=3028392 RepID=UPI003974B035
MNKNCPFCNIVDLDSAGRIIMQNDHAITIHDGYPISNGHTLIIPKRHSSSFFDASPHEREALLSLIDMAKLELDKEFRPDGYNIGINDSPTAGQTIPHLHIHLIPRYKYDVDDPRGGVRWIIPEKAKYWDD